MNTGATTLLFLLYVVASLGWLRNYRRRLELEVMLDESETERLQLRAFYERHRKAFETGVRGRGAIAASIDRSEFGRPRLVKGGDTA